MKQASFLVLLFLSGVSSSVAQPPQQPTIRGTVVDADTNAPIPEARVILRKQREAGAEIEITTYGPRIEPANPGTLVISDAAGRFQFADPAPGSYSLSVSRRGYEDEDADYFKVATGATLNDTVLRLTATAKLTGSVSGRVWNSSNGHPIAGLSIRLLRRQYTSEGNVSFEESATAFTNDLGEYRLYWVKPGRYIMVAGDPERRATWNYNVVPLNYGNVFHPGTRDLDKASTIRIQPGSTLTAMDFPIDRPTTYRIRGRIVDPATGKSPAGARLRLTKFGFTSSTSSGPVYDAATGTFEIPDLLPGPYELEARVSGTDGEDSRTAATLVVIANADVDGVLLSFADPTTVPRQISGRILVEGDLPSGSDLKKLGAGVQLIPAVRTDGFEGSFPLTEWAAANGSFTLNDIPDGEFRVGIAWMPKGFYLKEARLDGADAANQPRTFARGRELQVVLSSSGGALEGRATDELGQPVESAAVVLIPDGRERTDFYKREFTTKDGDFKIVGIAPGDYKLFAWQDLDEHEYFDPEFLKRFEDKVPAIHVAPSSRQVLNVKAVPAGEDR